jgi:hypothetical protein
MSTVSTEVNRTYYDVSYSVSVCQYALFSSVIVETGVAAQY